MARPIESVLVVEDNRRLWRALERALGDRFGELRLAHGVESARDVLHDFKPHLILLDFALPDGDAFDVLDALAGRRPQPVVIAMSGRAEPLDTFELARRGVRAFLSKPITIDSLESALRRFADAPPLVLPHVEQAVGHVTLTRLAGDVRDAMIDEALARTDGSRRGAARLLGISRQLLQYLLKQRA
jgi:DNA-binding NtrC family response regulator